MPFCCNTLFAQSAEGLWSKFDSLSTADTIGFSAFSEAEQKIIEYYNYPDSVTLNLLGDSASFNAEDNFLNKRSRIQIFHNDKIVKFSDVKGDFVPGICESWQANDTVNIITGIGFFAGYGFGIKIYREKFSVVFEPNADNDDEIYAWNKGDSNKMLRIEVPATKQYLALSKHINKKGELVFIGRLKADFREFFELKNDIELESHKYSVDIIFRTQIVELPKGF